MRLAADANVLLSALIGGRARLIIASPTISELLTAESTFSEVEEYALVLARKKHIPADILLLSMAAMPVTVVARSEYASSLRQARRKIGKRDPDDVDILALALHFKIPLWSNDKDFVGTGAELVTTEDLLRELGFI